VITIVLAEDHKLVREGIRLLLAAEPDLSVIGEVSDGLKVVQTVEKLDPDVLVLDLMLPGLNGLEITRQLAKAAPRTRVMILSMHASEPYVIEALRNGATGYCLKECSGTEMIACLRSVARGELWLSPPFSERALELYDKQAAAAAADPYDQLTTREREVFQLTAEGFTSPQIGQKLFISPRTVESHRANLMRKLSLHSQSDLVRLAIKRGLLPEPT
jgi:two-component system, NarL family, response regulator NreC